jgi:(2Fe-2S) ferredoxin
MVRHVFVCQGLFCSARGSRELTRELETRLAGGDAVVERYWCFNGCSHGPNILVPEDRCWYEGVSPADLEAIVRHAETGQPASPACRGRVPQVVKDNAYEAIERQYPAVGEAARQAGAASRLP